MMSEALLAHDDAHSTLDRLTEFFVSRFAGSRCADRQIGLELEFPVVRRNGEAITYDVAAYRSRGG